MPHRRRIVTAAAVILGLWLVLEIGLRIYVEYPLPTDFYGSITQDRIGAYQQAYGVRTAAGPGWIHLGWVADPAREHYRIERKISRGWSEIGHTRFGSYLIRGQGGLFRVTAVTRQEEHLLNEVQAQPLAGISPVSVPAIAGPWRTLFRPHTYGNYLNDHTVFRDATGAWRVVGITSATDGDFNAEKYFAVGTSPDFPPREPMREEAPVADFGALAWAPHAVTEQDTYYLFWSPHRLERLTSPDGITWKNPTTVIRAPYHKFFRDAMILKVADGQWLLYTTARGRFFSQVDLYQSFDLTGWQYIGTALRTGLGSERNSPFASTESPFVINYRGHYYLSVTYNNNTTAWNGLLLPFKIWLDRPSYNDTRIFHSDNPYDFGTYRGRKQAPSLLTELKAHAPEYVYVPAHDTWYITTAGWPWIATLTKGEVAVAPLQWRRK